MQKLMDKKIFSALGSEILLSLPVQCRNVDKKEVSKSRVGGLGLILMPDILNKSEKRAKNPLVQDRSLCLDTWKATSYLDHFCTRKVGVFAFFYLEKKIPLWIICAHSSLSRNAGNFAYVSRNSL